MSESGLIEQLQKTVDFIRSQSSFKPRAGIILGSGLGAFVDQIEVETTIPYSQIPGFPATTVVGHNGQLILGSVEGLPIVALQGRCHYYEGHSMERVVFPTRTISMLGIETLLVTNSAGGLDPAMKPGDFMIIDDHINLMNDNPLKGPNLKELGPRFPDMTKAYDPDLSNTLHEIMEQFQISHHRGVYCGVSGPTYETPAEVRFLSQIGGHAVGMSTVPETIAANHLGLRVCALSCITNLASGLSSEKLSHDEVTTTAKMVESQFCKILKEFANRLS